MTLLDDFEALEDAVVVVEADFRGRPRPLFLLLDFFPLTIGSSSFSSATSSFNSSSSFISLSRRCLFVVAVGLFVLLGGSIFSTFSIAAAFSTDFLLLFSFIDDGFFDVVVAVDAMTVVVDCFDCLLLLLLLLPVVFRLRFVTVNEAIVSTFN